jgi:hypothetical protein
MNKSARHKVAKSGTLERSQSAGFVQYHTYRGAPKSKKWVQTRRQSTGIELRGVDTNIVKL